MKAKAQIVERFLAMSMYAEVSIKEGKALHSQSMSLEYILLRCLVNECQVYTEVVERITGIGMEGLYILSKYMFEVPRYKGIVSI